MNKILIFDIDDTLILHTKDRNDYYKMDSGETLKDLIEQSSYDKIYIYTNGTYGHGYNVSKNLKLYIDRGISNDLAKESGFPVSLDSSSEKVSD